MTRTTRTLVGALTAWPYLYIPAFILAVAGMTLAPIAQVDPSWLLVGMPVLMVAHFGTIFALLGLMLFYVFHVFRNESYNTEQRLLWTLVLVLGGMLVMPVYYWMHIRPGATGSL